MIGNRVYAFLIVVVVLGNIFGELRGDVKCSIEGAAIDGRNVSYESEVQVIGECVKLDLWQLGVGDAMVRGARINGRGNQDGILFLLHAPRGEAKAGAVAQASGLKEMKAGGWYKMRGRLTDGVHQGTDPMIVMIVDHFEAVERAPLGLADFVDREARFDGEALRGGIFAVDGIAVRVQGVEEWPAHVIGKTIGVRGVVHRDGAGWRMDGANWGMVNLEDQLGRDVALEGRFHSVYPWFEYRGQKLYVIDDQGHTIKLRSEDYGRRIRLSGKLVRQLRPSMKQISIKHDRDLEQYFVVRSAKLEYLEDPIPSLQRWRPLYRTPNVMVDGVPELLAEHSMRRNIMLNETTAMYFRERNEVAVNWILHHLTPQSKDVLARRMEDAKRDQVLRLLYAAILAAGNDERGRSFLLDALRKKDEKTFVDTLYFIGALAWLMPEDYKIKTELAWAESALIRVMTEKDPKGRLISAELAAHYSDVPVVLGKIDTEATRRALAQFAISRPGYAGSVFRVMHESESLFGVEELLMLESFVTESFERRAVLSQLLKHNHPAAVTRFLKDFGEDGSIYWEFRERSSRAMRELLDSQCRRMSEQALANAWMLRVVNYDDPVPSIIALLDDPEWKNKGQAVYELGRLKDARAVAPVARKLREAGRNYFEKGEDRSVDSEVEAALKVVAGPGTKESVNELIRLFKSDLSRFGTHTDRAGFRRIIAAHLIEITGESFGTDADAWRKWNR